MKKIKFVIVAFGILTSSVVVAKGKDENNTIYFDMGYVFAHHFYKDKVDEYGNNTKDYTNNFSGFYVGTGFPLNNHFAYRFTYFQYLKKSNTSVRGMTIKLEYTFNPLQKIQYYSFAGVSVGQAKEEYQPNRYSTETNVNPSLGFGMNYFIRPKMAVNATLGYMVPTDDSGDSYTNGAIMPTVGFRYYI